MAYCGTGFQPVTDSGGEPAHKCVITNVSRAVRVKEFFGNRLIRDIAQPLLVEKFKSNLRKSDSKWERPFSPSTVNRYLTLLSLTQKEDNCCLEVSSLERR